MDTTDAVTLLADLDLPGAVDPTVTPVIGGWASWTFDVAGEHILRVARDREISDAHRREERLLPELAAAVDFSVPVPIRVGDHRGHRYMVYRRLPGRPLRIGDPTEPVWRALRQLHAFPVDRALELLGESPSWHDRYANEYREWIDRLVIPVLDTDLADRMRYAYDRMLGRLHDLTPTLIHCDLGVEHVLVDEEHGEVTGLIDFETATVGDPAIDLVGLLIAFGETSLRRLLVAGGMSVDWPRLRFYRWMGAVHAIHHGVLTDDPAIVADGISGLRDRLGVTTRHE
ncbi:aminoglycoside 2''-phosphotransferase [Stackebrandtia endophytica]|uniref:Aminoglycoside 2''-phosphotransferase n=1 Tax=Stackebrandtia endophytica TaxID=1496996 RepID=A0A543AQF5_9ACTN|nr:aminoglycoside phosphotransferase family protein [Stackebrandtia endophytica]TQL74823.1 aminoglycoside 2''-phosphotransferase [Stackebrandtia endophytica]